MPKPFDATITALVEIDAFDGYVIVPPGSYSVVLRQDRVELLRKDPAGEEPVTLTRTQWALLDGTRAFSADEAEQT
jgi:hypothetical protein